MRDRNEGMALLRGAPDAQDVTPSQRVCEHEVVLETWCDPRSVCVGCGAAVSDLRPAVELS